MYVLNSEESLHTRVQYIEPEQRGWSYLSKNYDNIFVKDYFFLLYFIFLLKKYRCHFRMSFNMYVLKWIEIFILKLISTPFLLITYYQVLIYQESL